MERLDGGSAVPAHLRGGIVALGNFDGFHLGHQAVVGRAIPRAKAAAVQAIEIDPQLGEAHVSLAYGLQYHDWNWKAAERALRSASRPLLQARSAALPADHAGPARAPVRRSRRGCDARVPF